MFQVKCFHKTLILLVSFFLTPSAFSADQKCNYPSKVQDKILLGTTTALTGPAKTLGQSMVRGMQTHLNEINATGGISGRLFKLMALDDGYHQQSAHTQMMKLINDYQVLAVVGNVGTPTAEATVPLANECKTPLIGAFTGASLLRKPVPDRYIINYRASYEEEMNKIITTLLNNDIHASRIAFFTQEDSYGKAGYDAAIKALKQQGIKNTSQLAQGRYEANTLDIRQALITIINARPQPKAIIMIGTYGPSAKFIRIAQKILPNSIFISISFVGAHALARELDGCCDNVYVSQVVPPLDADFPAVRNFKHSLERFYPDKDPDYVSFEGYLVAKFVTEAIRKIKAPIDPESLIDTIESVGQFDIGIGETLSYSKNEHQGNHHVWLTRINAKKVIKSDWKSLH